MIKATGLAYNPETRKWDKPVEYIASNRMEAIRWISFQREWLKDLKIIDA